MAEQDGGGKPSRWGFLAGAAAIAGRSVPGMLALVILILGLALIGRDVLVLAVEAWQGMYLETVNALAGCT